MFVRLWKKNYSLLSHIVSVNPTSTKKANRLMEANANVKIELALDEYQYIINSKFILKEYMHITTNENNKKYILIVTEDQADNIRDLCGEQLQLYGFDEQYNPTSEGKILESLIDKLSIG